MKSQTKKLCILSIIYALVLLFILFYYWLCLNGHGFSCCFQKHFGIQCISCGATRSFLSLMRLDIINAIRYNPIFTLVIYPFTLFFILQDYIVTLFNVVRKKQSISLISFLWNTLQKSKE